MAAMLIRRARPEDAETACQVLRRSITELCGLDHGDDPEILGRWLASKTPQNVATWIKNPRGRIIVAQEGASVLGLGGITQTGEITLNYVSPDARFRGVSDAMIRRLETIALEDGNDGCTLTSTRTAHRFYLARGYVTVAELPGKFGTDTSFAMAKTLADAAVEEFPERGDR